MGEKMSKKIKMLVIVALLAMSATAFGSLLLEENFDYTVGDSVLDHGWNLTGTNYAPAIYVYSPGLTYTGYASSGIGNAAKVDTNGQDVNKTYSSQTSGIVYASFMANVQIAKTGGDYFFHLGPLSIGSTFNGRVYVKNDGSGNLAFGLGKWTETATYTATYDYALNTTYLIVLKYEIVSGATNDLVSLFVFSSGAPTNEPITPTIGPFTYSNTDPGNIGSVALRQGSNTSGPAVIVDGIRIGQSWTDVLPSSAVPTKLTILSVNGGVSPTVNRPFNVSIQAQDDLGNPGNVSENTGVQLSLVSGTGLLGGTLTGTILQNENTVTITGVTYNTVQNGVSVKAETTFGDNLAPDTSAPFNVLAQASQLAFVGVPAAAQPGIVMGSFTVQAQRPDNSVDPSFADSIFLSIASGPGSISGTIRKKAVNGAVTYDNIILSSSGTYTLDATATGLTGATSSSINVLEITIPMIENFDYTVGTSLVHNGWSAHSGAGSNSVMVTTPGGLTYTGYSSSGIGNAATIFGGGEDVHRIFTSQTSGSVYAAFMINVTGAPTGWDYFAHFGPQTIGTNFKGKIFIKKNGLDSLSFGITKGNSTSPVDSTSYLYPLNTTYILILKYTFVDGATNDEIKLWINPSLTGSEPAANLTVTDGTPDLSNCGSFTLRQSSSTLVAAIDGIRVGLNWGIVSGNEPPTITNITKDPEMPLASDVVHVSAKIYDDSTGLGAVIDSFFYAQNVTSTWTSVIRDSFRSFDSLYFYTIPVTPSQGDTIFYRLSAADDDGNITSTSANRYIIPLELTVDQIQGGVPSSPYTGRYVYSKGIVTGNFAPDGFFGPGSDPFEGQVYFYRAYAESLPKTTLGDSIGVFGVVQEYKTLTEINANSYVGGAVKILNSGNPIPTPVNLAIADIYESYEGTLARVESLHFKNAKTTFAGDTTYWAFNNTETESLDIRIDNAATTIIGQTIPSDTLAIIGNITAYFDTFPAYQDTWQLMPRFWDDIASLSQILDVGIKTVDEPTGTLHQGHSYPVKATVKNYGNVPAPSFDVIFTISEGKVGEYCDTFTVTGLTVGHELPVTFDDPYLASNLGLYVTEAKTVLIGDASSLNDIGTGSGFEVVVAPIAVWAQIESIVTPHTDKTIKDGGALVGVPGSGKDPAKLFAFLGTKTNRFKKYTVGSGWSDAESLLFGHKYKASTYTVDTVKFAKKFPGKGAALCYDGENTIYATKGNGTNEFFAYDLTTDAGWTAKAFVPTPKGLKGGTSIRYYNGKVYLMAGGQKKDPTVNNFWVYDPAADSAGGTPWTALGKLPLGPNTKVWKDGASIIEVGGTFYAVKSADKTNLFYAYDWGTSTWLDKEPIPIDDSSYHKYKKKLIVKDGACTATDGSVIYATKGGGTEVFWKYTPGTPGIWERLNRMPIEKADKKHAPKTGAAMAYVDGAVYLLVGNKQVDYWRYEPGAEKTQVIRNKAQVIQTVNSTSVIRNPQFSFDISPNPFSKLTTIRYTVPISSKVSIKLYNASGRLIQTLNDGYLSAGNYTTTLSNIASGVYFLKYESNTNKSKLKLIVQ
jgi:hypothetical protein